jgi:transposase
MDTSANGELQPSSKSISQRRYRSALERRQIVEETLRPGASVAIIARAHEVNANQVFCWRKLYLQGLLNSRKESSELVPVRVSDAEPTHHGKPVKKDADGPACGSIVIELGTARVRIEGAVDPASLRAALDSLRR